MEEYNKVERNVNDYKCPILQDWFRNPVLASDGRFYEKKSLIEHLKYSNISPVVPSKILTNSFHECFMFDQELKEFKKRNGIVDKVSVIENLCELYECDEDNLVEVLLMFEPLKLEEILSALNYQHIKKHKFEILVWASQNGRVDLIINLLKKLTDNDLREKNNEMLKWIINNGHLKVVKLFMKRLTEDDIEIFDICENKNLEILKILSDFLSEECFQRLYKIYMLDPDSTTPEIIDFITSKLSNIPEEFSLF
jgi:hypothetical protein